MPEWLPANLQSDWITEPRLRNFHYVTHEDTERRRQSRRRGGKWGRGTPLLQADYIGSLSERRKLSQQGSGRAPAKIELLKYECQKSNLVVHILLNLNNSIDT